MATTPGQNYVSDLPFKLLDWVDRLSTMAATVIAGKVATAILATAIAGTTIYVMIYAFAVMRGAVQSPINDLVMKGVKMAIIVGVACTPALFSGYIINGEKELELMFLNAFSNTPSTTLAQAISNIVLSMDKNVKMFYGDMIFSMGALPIPEPSLLYAWIVMALSTIVLLIMAMIPLILAKIFLAMVLGVGPFFLLMAAWPATQRYAESWLSFLLTCTFSIVVVSFVVSFYPNVFGYLLSQFPQNPTAETKTNPVDMANVSLLVTIVLGYIAWNAMTFAGSLVGGGGFSNPANTLIQAGLNKLAFSGKGGGSGNKVDKK